MELHLPMKRKFLALLSPLFALAAITLVILQVIQTKRSAEMSDNLFNISVNNAMEDVFAQLDQMKVEDYVTPKERYRLLRYRRIEELNEKMQDILRVNPELFYDEQRVQFGISSQDSAFVLPQARITPEENSVITQYNTLLGARNRLLSTTDSREYQAALSATGSRINIEKVNFPMLDSIIREQLIINGVDVEPQVGVIQTGCDTILYYSPGADTAALRASAYKFSFHAGGISPAKETYVMLLFPSTPIILTDDVNLHMVFSIFMILLISALYYFATRTISSQRRLDEMKTDFINNMTHEIKTPIATIGLACEMLQDNTVENDSASRRNFVNIINEENRRMRVLIDTLLQSAKMSGKKFTLSPRETDLNAIVESAAQSFHLAIENRHGTIELDLKPIEGTLYADELHLTNMVHNLIDNAVKYSDKEPRILIGTGTENGHAVLRVTDHGIGIAREDQKHIFEKFYRVSTGNVHNVKGFGIGLNYVAQVVQLHHGKIALASEPGQGSTFTITLPLT